MTDVYILISQDEYDQLIKSGNVNSVLMKPITLHHSNQGGLSKVTPPSSKENNLIKHVGKGEIVNKEGQGDISSDDDSQDGSIASSSESEQSSFEERKDWFECWEGIHFKD